LNEVDVLLTSVTSTVAVPHPKLKSIHGERSTIIENISLSVGFSSNTSPFNSRGHLAMSVPCGFGTPEDGSPGRFLIGMQLIARRWDEEIIPNAAAVFKQGK
jgi:amidase